MGRRLLMVNVLILTGIVVLARYVTNAWREFDDTQNVSTVLDRVAGGKPAPESASVEVPPPPEAPLAFPNFTVIAEKDLFMPERRPAPPPDQQAAEVPPPMPKDPMLNGVLNNAGQKQAMVTIFEGKNPKGASRIVNIGDDIQGWTVSEIADTTMKLRWKDQEKLIDMFDASPQQQAAVPARNATAAVTVITIGSPAAPVETTTATEVAADERAGGIQVGVAGGQGVQGQRGPGQGMRGNAGRGNLGGDTMRGGTSGLGSGTVSGGTSVPFTSGNRRRSVP
jgi:hypothetical protein